MFHLQHKFKLNIVNTIKQRVIFGHHKRTNKQTTTIIY